MMKAGYSASLFVDVRTRLEGKTGDKESPEEV